jgi:1-acyl-sn-glycerol-3-phosphate acyltransferase
VGCTDGAHASSRAHAPGSGPRWWEEHVPATGPAILAPVHRSFADFGFAAFCTKRKLFFMTKDSMWKNKWLGKLLLYVGAFPVHRESADREALQRAEEVLRRGELLVLFPEGTRRGGPVIEDLMEGATFLSARTGAPIVPIGIGASDLAMPKGSAIPKPYTIQVVIGRPPGHPPRPAPGGDASHVRPCAPHLRTWWPQLQAVYDEAQGEDRPLLTDRPARPTYAVLAAGEGWLTSLRSRHQVATTTRA